MQVRFDTFFIWVISLWLGASLVGTAQQQCADPLAFTPVSQPNQIEWNKFPEFSLPFTIIYGGPRFNDNQASPLRHGFSHLINLNNEFIRPEQRAVIYYGFATGINQPWETLDSPWANDLTAYRAKWEQYLAELSGGQKNSAGLYILPTNRFALDVERIRESNAQILRLKQEASVPQIYRNLPDAEFVSAYKKAIRNLYAEGMRYVRQRTDLTNVSVSSYADTPILNTYLNVPTYSWTDWTTNLNQVNYLVKDSTEQRVGGPYYDQLDALSPSAYYYYDYPTALAKDYLSYLLFQVEVNRAWSNKPVLPWVWLRYHNSFSSYPNFIQPFMAEATAIFPFFSGAAGLWLWDEPGIETRRNDTYAAYEHFTHGLYRLSRFADMFQGQYELVIETPARDLMEKQLPVWRGVVKNTNILIAAQNPYANDAQKTSLTVRYKNWQRQIELTGREVYLCRFDMSAVTATEPVLGDVSVSPNPASTSLTVSFSRVPAPQTELRLLNIHGQILLKRQVNSVKEVIDSAHLPTGTYFLRVSNDTASQTKKVIITR
ncbi:T9SS type A sorting domain-containing protein [Spirosoma soli]|uniref:T9SS type A sorting domain-containing protein n=1 Tax=Spirosoma soli TaxID=1770529 RepID=A0ABW5M5K0_9BACT